MKKLFVLCMVVFAAWSAFAGTAYMRDSDQSLSWVRPDVVRNPDTGQEFKNPSDAMFAACGWSVVAYPDAPAKYLVVSWSPPAIRYMDEVERQAVDAAEYAAQTNAEYQASLPIVESRGFEVPYVVFQDATNRQKGIAFELTETGDQIIYEFHASPVDWGKVKANRNAALGRLAARKAAVENVKIKGSAANSVPALREAFSNLCVELNRQWIIPGL